MMKAILVGVFWVLAAGSAMAQGDWDYGSWRVSTFSENVGTAGIVEDVYHYCIASSGGDGDARISIEFMSHDAGPPTVYPSVVIEEYAPRGYDTQMQDGMTGYIIFDSYETAAATPVTSYDPDGYKRARVSYDQPYSQWMLQKMQANGRLDLVVQGRPVAAFQLNGFSAAYLKAADECGFSGVGVIP